MGKLLKGGSSARDYGVFVLIAIFAVIFMIYAIRFLVAVYYFIVHDYNIYEHRYIEHLKDLTIYKK